MEIVANGPPDGLQIEVDIVLTAMKLDLIGRLRMAGLKKIEATSFVSTKWIPQMEDHIQIVSGLKQHPGVSYSVLSPT